MYRRLMVAVTIVVMFSGSAPADWPQYLGPHKNATAPGAKPARSWPEGGPKVLWNISLGPGYGSAAVSDGKVYVLDPKQMRCVLVGPAG